MSHFETFLVDNSQEAGTVRLLTAEEIETVAGAIGTQPQTVSMHLCGSQDTKAEE